MAMRSRDEIERLKAEWLSDPCYDIEDTDGFEEHREELKAFRFEVARRHHEEFKRKALAKSERLGCPGNYELGVYIIGLETRIAMLEAALEKAGR